MKTAIFGVILFLTVFLIGFIPISEATWLQWKALWLLGGGGLMGLGIGLVIVGIVNEKLEEN